MQVLEQIETEAEDPFQSGEVRGRPRRDLAGLGMRDRERRDIVAGEQGRWTVFNDQQRGRRRRASAEHFDREVYAQRWLISALENDKRFEAAEVRGRERCTFVGSPRTCVEHVVGATADQDDLLLADALDRGVESARLGCRARVVLWRRRADRHGRGDCVEYDELFGHGFSPWPG
ncbi:MAG: hypothetical protein ABSF67_18390 [Roseiarcus sp.]